MNKFKQEVIEIYKIKKELEERLNCMHKMLFTGTTIPYHAFPYVYSYLFETLARLTKISFWVNKNRFKMVLCKDRQTIILLKDIIREKILLTRIYHYIEILGVKQRKTEGRREAWLLVLRSAAVWDRNWKKRSCRFLSIPGLPTRRISGRLWALSPFWLPGNACSHMRWC